MLDAFRSELSGRRFLSRFYEDNWRRHNDALRVNHRKAEAEQRGIRQLFQPCSPWPALRFERTLRPEFELRALTGFDWARLLEGRVFLTTYIGCTPGSDCYKGGSVATVPEARVFSEISTYS